MTANRWQRLKTLFGKALECDGAERQEFVAAATAGEPEVRASLLSLIAYHESAITILDGPIVSSERITEYLAAGMRTFHQDEVVAGRFQIEGFLGEGGMGEVYRARDLELGESVALKTLRPLLTNDEDLIRRFKSEIQTARRVTHRNVSRVFELFRWEVHEQPKTRTITFLTMEFLSGETLAQRIESRGAIPADEALDFVAQMAAGLGAAHTAGFLHRDLKSSNVMLVDEPEGNTRVVISDFGIACPRDVSQRREADSGIMGTLAYAAPEQLRGSANTTACDIYSLGVVIFEMRCAQLPFRAETLQEALAQRDAPAPSPRRYLPSIEPRWESVILSCLEADPQRRPSTAHEVVRRLQPPSATRRMFVAGSAVAATVASAALFILRPQSRNPEALRHFRLGQEFAQRRNEPGLRNAIIEFSQATKIDPGYGDAWIGIADAYSAMANFCFTEPRPALAAAREAAAKAASLTGASGLATGALGYIISLNVEGWRTADSHFLRAIEAEPRDARIRLWYAAHLGKLGRSTEAFQQLRLGLEQDPISLSLNQQLASQYFWAREFSEYYIQAKELVRLQPFEGSSHLSLARALEFQGKYPAALESCQDARRYTASIPSLCFRGCVEASSGDLTAARADAEEVRAYWESHPFQTALLASLYARLGEKRLAIDALNQGFERGDSTVLISKVNPYFDTLKDERGFNNFLRRLGWNAS